MKIKKKDNRKKKGPVNKEQKHDENSPSVPNNENLTRSTLERSQTSYQNLSLNDQSSNARSNTFDKTQRTRPTAKKCKYKRFDLFLNENKESETKNDCSSSDIPDSPSASEQQSDYLTYPPFPNERYKETPALKESWIYFSTFFERIHTEKLRNAYLINLAKEKGLNITFNTKETISCIWEPAKNDLSFDTRHPDWLGYEMSNSLNKHNEKPQSEPMFTTADQNTECEQTLLRMNGQEKEMEQLRSFIAQIDVTATTTTTVVTAVNDNVINLSENIAKQPPLSKINDEDVQEQMVLEDNKLISNDSKIEGKSTKSSEDLNFLHEIYENIPKAESQLYYDFTTGGVIIDETDTEQIKHEHYDESDEERIYLRALLQELENEIESGKKTQSQTTVDLSSANIKQTSSETISPTTINISQNFNSEESKERENISRQKPKQPEYVFKENVKNIPLSTQSDKKISDGSRISNSMPANVTKGNNIQPLSKNVKPKETSFNTNQTQRRTDKPTVLPQSPLTSEGYNNHVIHSQKSNFNLQESDRPLQHGFHVPEVPQWRKNISPYNKRDIVCTEPICYPYSHNINVLSYAPSNITKQTLSTSTIAGNVNHRPNQIYYKPNAQWQQPNMQHMYQPQSNMYLQRFEHPVQQNVNPFPNQAMYQRPQWQQYNTFHNPAYNMWQNNNYVQPMWVNSNYQSRSTTPVNSTPFHRTSPVPPQCPISTQNPFYGPYTLHTSPGHTNLADRRNAGNNYGMQSPAKGNNNFTSTGPLNEKIPVVSQTSCRHRQGYRYEPAKEFNHQTIPKHTTLVSPQIPWGNSKPKNFEQKFEDPSIYQISFKESHPEIYNIWGNQTKKTKVDMNSDKISDVTKDIQKLDILNSDKREIPRKEFIARSHRLWKVDIPNPKKKQTEMDNPRIDSKQDVGQQIDMNTGMSCNCAVTSENNMPGQKTLVFWKKNKSPEKEHEKDEQNNP